MWSKALVRVPCGVMVKRVLKMDEEWDETTKQVAGYTPEIDMGYLTKGGSTFMSDDEEAAAAAAVRAEQQKQQQQQQQEDDAEFNKDLNVYSEKDLEAISSMCCSGRGCQSLSSGSLSGSDGKTTYHHSKVDVH